MGRKGNWFSAVKKALHPESKEKTQESAKAKKKWFRKKKRHAQNATPVETAPAATAAPPAPVLPPVVIPTEPPKSSGVDKEQLKHTHVEPPKVSGVEVAQARSSYTAPVTEPPKLSGVDNEQTKHAYTVALGTAKAAEAAVAAAQAATEVVRLTAAGRSVPEKSKEELAAIKIQTAFRGYMARRTLRALRGLMRLKTVMQGQAVKRQTTNTLKSMQTLARVQTQIRERRLRLAEENMARQKQIQQKNLKEQAKELEKLQQSGDGWDSSGKTKEQIEAKMQSRHEAAIRRERTLAYAFSHQQAWKGPGRSATTLFMDSNNPHWGWSWLERWLAARPWETATMSEKEHSSDNSPRVKTSKQAIPGDEILKSYARRHTSEKPSPTSSVPKQPRPSTGRLSTSSVPSKTSAAARKLISSSPKASPRASIWGVDDDARSMQSEQSRRPSVTGSEIRDEESLTSSQTVPSYMTPTESAKAKSRLGGETKRDKSVTPDRMSVSSAKKKGSYPASPARSRRSTSSAADMNSLSDLNNM